MKLAANRTQTFHQVARIILHPIQKIVVTGSYSRQVEIKIEEGDNLSATNITLFAISSDNLQFKKEE